MINKQPEWRGIGVQQSRGWEHYACHRPEPHILLFRRPLGTVYIIIYINIIINIINIIIVYRIQYQVKLIQKRKEKQKKNIVMNLLLINANKQLNFQYNNITFVITGLKIDKYI